MIQGVEEGGGGEIGLVTRIMLWPPSRKATLAPILLIIVLLLILYLFGGRAVELHILYIKRLAKSSLA